MPSIINAATSGGLISTADTSGVLQLQTANTTAVTIDASQNVGVGTASPTASKLHIAGYNGGTTYPIRMTSSNSGVEWSFETGGSAAGSSFLAFRDMGNSAERMRLNSTGALVLTGGNTSANGTGITFPATQSASSDANTLDDYEEGSWTPSIGGTATYATQNGKYTKIGNVVTVTFDMTISVIGTGSTALISNLPFTSIETTAGTVTYYETLSRAYTFISCYVGNGTATISFTGNNATATTTIGFNGASLFQNNARVLGAITYRV